jgi:hypothetical protein
LALSRKAPTRWPQLFPAAAFFGAQVAANPPAFAATNSRGHDGGGDVAQAKIILSASQYNAYLAGWVFAFSVVLVTIMLIEHGVHF